MADVSSLRLNKLRVTWRGTPVYEQNFHSGVNIIRGENGSGKSTVADFIFYILGGEFEDWKDAAGQCDEVQAEIETARGKLTLRRDVGKKLTPIKVFFGPYETAEESALDGWETFPIRRQERQESFSQLMFRSIGIPEAQSEGASNITMHQLMRLLYADQRTPSTRLFRFEPFDTQNIREAVGDLVCGISGYEIYEINLALRDLDNEFDEARRKLSALIASLPVGEKLNNPDLIQKQVSELEAEMKGLEGEIQNIDGFVGETETNSFLRERQEAYKKVQKAKAKLAACEENIQKNQLEYDELQDFLTFLNEMIEKIGLAEQAQMAIGGIEFTHCPACLSLLEPKSDPTHCNVCGSETDPEDEKAKYNQIRFDLEVQQRETHQLIDEKEIALKRGRVELRNLKAAYSDEVSSFTLRYDLSSSPRESFLAARNQRIGQIEREIGYLQRALGLAEEIQELSALKATLQERIQKLKDRKEALTIQANKRRRVALTAVSQIASRLLQSDLDRQPEFKAAENVLVNFMDDAIFVDGKMNFAESSNVFLKNAAIFGMFLAAGKDSQFYHPRFLLLDNIEDKGMEVQRSHLFQRLIVEQATEIDLPYQIIFTTSMMNPALELDDYVIGPHYTHEERTLLLP